MKSLSKADSATLALQSWDAPELDNDVSLPDLSEQGQQILALFGAGLEAASRGQDSGSRTNIHPAGTRLSLTTWLPGDISRPHDPISREPWNFIETSLDSFKTAEPQTVKNRSEVEKEKAQVLREARLQADQILEEARAAAVQIIRQAEVDSTQLKDAGYQQGRESARVEMQSALAFTHELVQATQQWQANLMKDGEVILTGMLKELAQAMFGDGVRLDADALQLNLNRIMENAQRLGDLNIFLNPRDANLLDASWRDYQLLITGNKVQIIPSDKIKPGGCIVKGNMGMVDARVETQLAAILHTIDEAGEVAK